MEASLQGRSRATATLKIVAGGGYRYNQHIAVRDEAALPDLAALLRAITASRKFRSRPSGHQDINFLKKLEFNAGTAFR
jgi:hypothetical protein